MWKKYQVRGLLEWKALIPAGRGFIRVTFSGGQMSASGMSPAEFVTGNRALQRLIETSDYYQSGRIIIHPGSVEAPKKRKAQSPQSSQTGQTSPTGPTGLTSQTTPTPDNNENISNSTDPADDGQDGCGPDEYNGC